MNETISEYLHYVVNTIIFVGAVVALMLFLTMLSKSNRGEIDAMRGKADVTMTTDDFGYQEEFIYKTGAEVFTDIIDAELDGRKVGLDGVIFSDAYLKDLKENNTGTVNNLRGRISFGSNYLVTYRYTTENNSVYSVKYLRQ